MNNTTLKRRTFLRLPDVRARVGLSRSQIYKMIAKGTFPAPIALSERAVAWDEESIDAWMDSRMHSGGAA